MWTQMPIRTVDTCQSTNSSLHARPSEHSRTKAAAEVMPVFSGDIDHFKNNRNCFFAPTRSSHVSETTLAFGAADMCGSSYATPALGITFHIPDNSKHHYHSNDGKNSDSGSYVEDSDTQVNYNAVEPFTRIFCVPLRVIDGLSALQSFGLFVTACVFASRGAKNVDLWNQVLVVHNSTEVASASQLFATQVRHWCWGVPQIPQLNAYGFPALPMIVNSFEVNLWLLNIPIFFTSMCFQGYRYVAACRPLLGFKQYNPTQGADLGRWIEYMLTSPLQVVIVAIAYHIRDESQLWSLALMQATLVIMGYCIEREAFWWQTRQYRFESEYNALLVLVVVSWIVHFVLWLKIILFRWLVEVDVMDTCSSESFAVGGVMPGDHTHWATTTQISGHDLTMQAYGLTHDSIHDNYTMDMDWKSRKVIIDLLFATQFVFFTLFGIVNLLTLWDIRQNLKKSNVVDPHSIQTVWGTTTKRYSVLSILVKTLLEIFFFWYVLINPSGREST